jgi:ribosomal protein S18 acetylase RimI-like enzyme
LDAEEILSVQKAAFLIEARRHDDFEIPPMTETADELRAAFPGKVILKAILDGHVAGSVRGFVKEGTCYIGRLSVRPDLQKRGIGTALMDAIEARFSSAARCELFTGHKSADNIRLYERRGYGIFRSDDHVVWMERNAQPASSSHATRGPVTK